jgi:hypothetical protein
VAALTTAEKADIIVTDQFGAPVTGVSYTLAPDGILGHQSVDGVFQVWGQAEGEATITATAGGSTGQLVVSVTASPLGLSLANVRSKLS